MLGCSTLLSTGDKLTLIKYVFSSLPIFFMCSLQIPIIVMNQLNNYFRNCFWRKYGSQDRGAVLIAWNTACQPMANGGLGILNIEVHNKALLLKQVHKFLNKENIPWVNIIWESYYQTSLPGERMVGSFWWKTLLKLLPSTKNLLFLLLILATQHFSGQIAGGISPSKKFP